MEPLEPLAAKGAAALPALAVSGQKVFPAFGQLGVVARAPQHGAALRLQIGWNRLNRSLRKAPPPSQRSLCPARRCSQPSASSASLPARLSTAPPCGFRSDGTA